MSAATPSWVIRSRRCLSGSSSPPRCAGEGGPARGPPGEGDLLSSLIFLDLVMMCFKKTSIFDLVESDVTKTRQKFLAWYYW